jgi:hypothetical protein
MVKKKNREVPLFLETLGIFETSDYLFSEEKG